MLHDPSHSPTAQSEESILFSAKEKEILRKLGAQIFEISQDPVNDERARLWRKLNDLHAERPMVWINEVPWHEMNVGDELTLRCEGEYARMLEARMRRTLYQWRHFPGDMVVSPYIVCEKAIHSTAFGIVEDVDKAFVDQDNDIYSRHFHIQIRSKEDIEKIKMPVVTYLPETTQRSYEAMRDVFADVIDVRLEGQTHIWFTPWDYLIRWWGIEEAMIDLVERPELVVKAYERMVDAWMVELDQFEKQNLLSLDCNNTRVGSGGYGYVSDLPGEGFDPGHVRAADMWGCSNAQIFSSVSPQMHFDFALKHDLRWLERFKHTYYGCCEPLDQKIAILRRIPNLRKVSVSAWADGRRAASEIGRDYVLSRKPTPAVFANGRFDVESATKDLADFHSITKDLNVEYIMKDVSTVSHRPQSLWAWEKLAMKLVTGGKL